MDLTGLKQRLSASGHDTGGSLQDDVISFLTCGPNITLTDYDYKLAAERLQSPLSHVLGVYHVESTGNPFVDGHPTILFEPHIFSKLTGHIYDGLYPRISSRTWNPKLYPKQQSDRYLQLAQAISVNPDAGFGSASYGGFQILGCNYFRCEAKDAMAFAWQEAQSAGDQLNHFCSFITSDPIIWKAFRMGDWVTFAKRYNGTAYFKNRYDIRLAKAVRAAS